jgi:hypothetical protein
MQNAKCKMQMQMQEKPLTLFAIQQKDLSPRGRGIPKEFEINELTNPICLIVFDSI